MNNGCPKCEKLGEHGLCLKHQLEQAEWSSMRWMNEVERIKQKIAKEKENDVSSL